VTAELTIRLARLEEAAALESLQLRASTFWEDYREALLADPSLVKVPLEQIEAGRVFVAERGGKVAGFAVILPREDGDGELDGLFVEPELWRRGIARALLARGEALARANGAKAIYVVANRRALEFYRACGFVRTSETKTLLDVADVMRKPLA
jgi:N-acetylglutamate synthase-like GNAT family acetyltransferase